MYPAASHAPVAQQHSLAPPFSHDSPYLSSPYGQDSRFGPHDPAWLSPYSNPASSQFDHGAFVFEGADGGDQDDELEILALAEPPIDAAFETVAFRRYSEGDRPASGTSDRFPYPVDAPRFYDSPSQPTFFDSGYTLAPAAPPLAAQAAVYTPDRLSKSVEISPNSASFSRMTRSHWHQDQQHPRVAHAYEQDSAPHELLDATPYVQHDVFPEDALHDYVPVSTSLPRTVEQPIPRRATQPSVLASPSFTPFPPDRSLASPYDGCVSPRQNVIASSGDGPVRPGLIRSHTDTSPEFATQPEFLADQLAPVSVPRHNSWSSPQQVGHFQPQHDEPSRRHSVQAGSPVAYAPYPSVAARRRSSQSAMRQQSMAGSPIRASGMTWTPNSNRRSAGFSATAPARHDDFDDLTPPTSFAPTTPRSRRTSYAAEVNAGSPAHPYAVSPAFSFSARRPHPNLSISVNASSPSRRSSTATSGMGPYRSPFDSPFSPMSPYANSSVNTPATAASACSSAFPAHEQYSPMLSSSHGRDAHGRRYTDSYAMVPSKIAGLDPSARRRSHGTMRHASAAALASSSTTVDSSLSGYAGGAPTPHLLQSSGDQLQAFAGTDESMAWSASPAFSRQWSAAAPSGSLDLAAGADMPLDGTVGLGLEMSLEEVHLAVPGTGVAPNAMHIDTSLPAAYDHMGVLEAQQQTAYCALAHREGSQQDQIQRDIRTYLAADNGMALGEKSVVILNPKIAQRSYGMEKRLLAPPPMALLLGSSWWSTHPSTNALSLVSGRLPSPDHPSRSLTLAPEVFISISSDKVFSKASASAQWIAEDGKLVLERDEIDPAPLAGRAMSKSLAVNVTGELNKDISTTVETVVTICEPGVGDIEPRVWARFTGKPMSVISKPSKKRAIVSGNIAGLSHGSIISLYNRTKTYSGSTRYLCTSGVASMFPTQQWAAMTGGTVPRTFAPDSRDLRLVSKTNVWDAFVVYAADIDTEHGRQSSARPQPGFPPPPSNALPVDPKIQRSLYYNQTVVLQDLATGVVSPVLVLRRVDDGNVCTGGGSSTSVVPPPPNNPELYPTLAGEQLGEPVSQYRPIALEVARRPTSSQAPASDGVRPKDTFLGVVDDEVGMYSLDESRTWIRAPNEPTDLPVTPTTPNTDMSNLARSQPAGDLGEYDLARADPLVEYASPRTSTRPRAPRRTSADTKQLSTPAMKNRRRGLSAAALAELSSAAEREVRGGAAGLWTLPLGEGHVWSMVQVEVERHTFFVPPSLDNQSPSSSNDCSLSNPMYRTPRPRTPIGPDVPAVYYAERPLPSSLREGEAGMIALHGRHLTSDLAVWIGDTPCPQVHFRSSEQILVRPPAATLKRSRNRRDHASGDMGSGLDKSTRIALVRPDGVVFPTQVCC